MKPRIHPVSRPVVFRDRAAGVAFLTRSTADADQRVEWEDGNSYPVIDVETSSASHPFYTGTNRVVDTMRPDRAVPAPLRNDGALRALKPRATRHSGRCRFLGTGRDGLSFTYMWMTR